MWAQYHLTVSGGGNHALPSDIVTDNRARSSWAGLGLVFAVSAYINAARVGPLPNVSGSAATANAIYQLYADDHLVQNTWPTNSGVISFPPPGALVFYPSATSGGQIAVSAGGGGGYLCQLLG
jgi:hypothetical protein